MKKILHQYYYLAFVTTLITIFTYQSIAADINYSYVLLVGIATHMTYNFHPLMKFSLQELNKEIRIWHIFYTLGLLIIGFITMYQASFYIWLALFIACILCICYFKKVFGFSLRDHYLTKPLTIGIVFGICTALIPYLQSGYLIMESLGLTLGRVFFVTVLAIIFDIGDVNQDQLEKTTTIPERFGVLKTKILCISLLVAAFIIESIGAWNFLIDLDGIVALCFSYFVTFMAILLSNTTRKSWFFTLFVDGIMALPLVFSYLIKL